MSSPFLIGRRLQLRPFEEEDAPVLTRWVNDPEIRQYLTGRRFPMTVKGEKEWLASLGAHHGTPRDLAMGIELKRGRRLIGSVGLHSIDWVHRRGMSGCFIGPPSMRGRGYGSEAKNLLLDHAFGELGLESVWAFIIAGNEPSGRALIKQGYRQGGVFRNAALIAGRWKDCLYYDILREDWERLRGRKTAQRAGKPRIDSPPARR